MCCDCSISTLTLDEASIIFVCQNTSSPSATPHWETTRSDPVRFALLPFVPFKNPDIGTALGDLQAVDLDHTTVVRTTVPPRTLCPSPTH